VKTRRTSRFTHSTLCAKPFMQTFSSPASTMLAFCSTAATKSAPCLGGHHREEARTAPGVQNLANATSLFTPEKHKVHHTAKQSENK
jgi:hypothetical protein